MHNHAWKTWIRLVCTIWILDVVFHLPFLSIKFTSVAALVLKAGAAASVRCGREAFCP